MHGCVIDMSLDTISCRQWLLSELDLSTAFVLLVSSGAFLMELLGKCFHVMYSMLSLPLNVGILMREVIVLY